MLKLLPTIALTVLQLILSSSLSASSPAGNSSWGSSSSLLIGRINSKNSMGPEAGSWTKWQNQPLEIEVAIAVNGLKAGLGTSFFATLHDATITALGADCGVETNLDVVVAHLRPYQEYQLVVGATNLNSYTLSFTPRNPDCVLPGKLLTSALGPGRRPGTLPSDYHVYVNGTPLADIVKTDTGPCGAYGTNWTIEIHKGMDPTFRIDDDDNEPDMAPGDGRPISIGPGKEGVADQNSWSWSVSLGHVVNGNKAGKLNLTDRGLSLNNFKPQALFHSAKDTAIKKQLVYVKTNEFVGEIRQMRTPQTFVDILPGTNQYWIRFYGPNQVGTQTNQFGVYTNISGSPLVTWWVLNPAGTGVYTNLQIIEQRNGVNQTNELIYNAAATTWTAKLGSGTNARVETRAIALSGSPTSTRVETVEVKNGAGVTAYKSAETYTFDGYVWPLTQQVDDPGGSSLTTSFSYYSWGTNPENRGRLHSIIYPDGYWETRDNYPYVGDDRLQGKLRDIWKPWMDAPTDPSSAQKVDSFVTGYSYWDYGLFWIANGFGNYRASSPPPSGSAWSHNEIIYREGLERPIDAGGPDIKLILTRENRGAGDGDDSGEWITKLQFYNQSPKFLVDLPVYTGPDNHQPGFPSDNPLRDRPSQHFSYDFGNYDTNSKSFTVDTNGFSVAETNLLDFRKTTLVSFALHPGIAGQSNNAPGEMLSTIDAHMINVEQGGPKMYANSNQTWKETLVLRRGVPVLKEKYVCIGVTNAVYTLGTTNREAAFELVEKFTFGTDQLGHITNITRIDPVSGASRITYSADYKGGGSVDSDLKYSEINEDGIQTVYTYDTLKRVATLTKKGGSASGYPTQADVVTSFAYDAKDRKLSETRASGTLSLSQTWSFDVAGRLTTTKDEGGLITSYSYSYPSGTGKIVTKTMPGGVTEIQSFYLDRRLKSITGTAKVNEFHTYAISSTAGVGGMGTITKGTLYDQVTYGSNGAVRASTTLSEGPYRTPCQIKPGLTFGASLAWDTNIVQSYKELFGHDIPLSEGNSFTGTGNLTQFNPIHYEYDPFGRRSKVWRDADAVPNGLNPESLDRLTQTDYFFRKIGTSWYEVTTNYVYRIDNDSTPTFAGATLKRINGLSSTTKSEESSIDPDNNLSKITVTVDRANKKVTETYDAANSTLNAVRVTFNGLLQTETTPSISGAHTHRYDALGRETQTINPLGASAYQVYGADGRVIQAIDFLGNTNSINYYPTNHQNVGLVMSQVAPNGKVTYYAYTTRGELTRTWGDVPYPEERIYNQFGDLVELHTFRVGTSWSGASWPTASQTNITRWFYEEQSGLLTNKTDAAGVPTAFFYTNSQLAVKILGRGVGITNLYNHLGELVATDYSDATPPTRFSYNRLGQMATVTDALGTDRPITYDAAARVLNSEDDVTYAYDGLNGLSEVSFDGQKQVFKYDTYGRMNLVSNGTFAVSYAYQANTDKILSCTFKTNSTVALTTTRGWEFGERLRSIQNVANGTTVSAFDYLYDAGGRRSQVTLEDGSIWKYGYNDRNEVVSARHTWSDWSPMPGQAFEYGFDPIGNRTTFKQGGDSNGLNLRLGTNDFNSLNQLITHAYKGAFDVIGAVEMTASNVTVNSQAAFRKGEYFQKEVSANNTNLPVYVTATVSATYNGATTTTNGSTLLAATPERLSYDADGNLRSDGIWTYSWDAENRLTGMTCTNTASGLPNSEKKRLGFTYDHMGRRRTKTVETWNGTAFASGVTTQYLYDGWRLLAEKDGSGNLLRSYVWGIDLSGDRDSAGGIGGLVMVIEHSPSFAVHFPMFDGNGNVVGLVRSSGGVTARYETGPFGEPIRATGPLAKTNPIRFSTKPIDDESGLAYYGYRFYSASQGRWVSRDPIEEGDGNNLYALVHNDPIDAFDPQGQATFVELLVDTSLEYGEEAADAARGLSIKSRVKDVVNTLNAIESFKEGWMTASDMMGIDGTEMLGRLQELRAEQAQGMRGHNSLSFAEKQNHHIFPQAFREQFKNIAKGKFDIDQFAVRMNEALHLKGLHGGGYNNMFKNFLKEKGGRIKKDPMFLFGFGLGVMNESGFGNFKVIPY